MGVNIWELGFAALSPQLFSTCLEAFHFIFIGDLFFLLYLLPGNCVWLSVAHVPGSVLADNLEF